MSSMNNTPKHSKNDAKVDWGFLFSAALTLVFAIGKVFGFLDWAWWIVFSPIWGYFVFLLFVFLIVLIIGVVVTLAEDLGDS